jgi:predicted RNase H-like HicB family nuclease
MAATADAITAKWDVQSGAESSGQVAPAHLLMGIAAFDGQDWTALAPALDVASVGETAEMAFLNLSQAIHELLEYAGPERLAGHAAPPEAVREFILGHRGPFTVHMRTLSI